jgi:uncharacterized membrane protein
MLRMIRILVVTFAICLLCLPAAIQLQAQTQASFTFQTFSLPGNPLVFVNGVNDYGTVVGDAWFPNATVHAKAFVHHANGKTVYWLPPGAVLSGFYGRNDSGVTTGAYFAASNQHHAFLRKGSTMTAISKPPDASPIRINKYNTVAGTYADSAGLSHGFRRGSDGSVIHLNYPGATQTLANGINDIGVIVGFYLDANNAGHGFIYHNGAWAKLQFPNGRSTQLYGISDANVIVGESGQLYAYMYKNGVTKQIVFPGSTTTQVRAIAPGGLIAGMSDKTHGFLATCH